MNDVTFFRFMAVVMMLATTSSLIAAVALLHYTGSTVLTVTNLVGAVSGFLGNLGWVWYTRQLKE